MNVWNEMDFSLNVIEKMHCSSHVNALLDNVEAPRLKPITQKSFEELQEELLDPAWLPDLEYDLDLLDIIAHTTISDVVRALCTEELRRGAQGDWRW